MEKLVEPFLLYYQFQNLYILICFYFHQV